MTMPTAAPPQMNWPRRIAARLRRAWAPPTIVLVYHRVLPEIARDPLALAVREDRFAGQMAWLAAHTATISVDDLISEVRRDRSLRYADPRPRVLVTFDDGYADNVRVALPILRRCAVPAVVFATTGAIATGESYWWDWLIRIFAARGDSPESTLREHARLKAMAASERDAELRRMAKASGVDRAAAEQDRPMTWDELRAWAAAGCEVGGHTRTHPRLSSLSRMAIRGEIAGCRMDLQTRLGVPVRVFAYPYGSADAFDARCEDAVKDAGYACAFANIPGQIRWARSAAALPRCLVRDWEIGEFAAHVRRWCGLGVAS
ncbi:MAG: hypothetical protein AMXMBFR47_05430 [Planctomycetota bacterium]